MDAYQSTAAQYLTGVDQPPVHLPEVQLFTAATEYHHGHGDRGGELELQFTRAPGLGMASEIVADKLMSPGECGLLVNVGRVSM